jgi:hypothetical protein
LKSAPANPWKRQVVCATMLPEALTYVEIRRAVLEPQVRGVVDVVVIGKGRFVLIVVDGMRLCVTGIDA